MPIKKYKKGKRRKSFDPLDSLAQQIKKTSFPDQNIEFLKSPEGVEKMSDVLEHFVAPYEHLADDLDAQERLYAVAVVAWNATLLPQNKQQAFINELATSLPDDDETQTDFRELVHLLMERKNRYFAANKRFIASFKLIAVGDGYHLSVASSLPG